MKDTNTINEGLDRLNLSIMYTMAFFILVFAISNIALATSQTQKSTIPLTQEEKKWLKEHPVILVSNQINWRPFDFLEDGKPSGFSVEYLNLINKLSFWDALIVVAAESAKCEKLWSEALNDGQVMSGVRIENPLKS